jgi:hypothetical protein
VRGSGDGAQGEEIADAIPEEYRQGAVDDARPADTAAGPSLRLLAALGAAVAVLALLLQFVFTTATRHPGVAPPLPQGPAPVVGVDQGRCTSVAVDARIEQWPTPYHQTTQPSDVQRPPGQIDGMGLAHGALVLDVPAGGGDTLAGSALLKALAANFADASTAVYADTGATDGVSEFLTVDLATPKPGLCVDQLAYDGLKWFGGGGEVGGIHAMAPGARLRAAHAVLQCGSGNGGLPTIYNTCAWAGPDGGAGRPFFGEFWIAPDMTNKAVAGLTDAQAAAFADALFGELTQ